MARIIAILSDFGFSDNYLGIMKGVIKKISPFADIIDLNNNIKHGDIQSAAYQLQTAYNYFPDNTIFLCVVDPEVGSERRAIAIETTNKFFIAPDNGLLTPIIQNEKINIAVELNNPKFQNKNISNTFHGRDIFAPIAAYLAQKMELDEIGKIISSDTIKLMENLPKLDDNSIEGKIIHTDNFGNLISNIHLDDEFKKKRNKQDNSCRI